MEFKTPWCIRVCKVKSFNSNLSTIKIKIAWKLPEMTITWWLSGYKCVTILIPIYFLETK